MNRSFFIILILSICVSANFGFAQDVDGRLMAFNEVIAPNYKVERKGGDLVIEGYREGELVKVDKVNIFDLDMETLKISSVDSTVSVKCYSDLDGCVARTLTKERNKKSYRNRLVFGIDEGRSGEEIAEKLRLFIEDLAKKN